MLPAHNHYTIPTSTSGSSPTVAEKRTIKALSVRTVDEDVAPGRRYSVLELLRVQRGAY